MLKDCHQPFTNVRCHSLNSKTNPLILCLDFSVGLSEQRYTITQVKLYL